MDTEGTIPAGGSAAGEEGVGMGKADEDTCLRVCVSWVSGLETVAVSKDGVIAHIAEAVLAAPDVPAAHKLFIFRGSLLDKHSSVTKAQLYEGCVLHMVLNEAQITGKALFVRRVSDDAVVTLNCSPDFSIREVKHELASLPGGRPPSAMRLVFAGRELEDQHTLREYNIQKPSVLLLLAEPVHARGLENFVAAVEPERDSISVPSDARIGVHFKRVVQDESHFWGQMLGSPDIHSLTINDFQPSQPLLLGTHYQVSINTGPASERKPTFFDTRRGGDIGAHAYAPTSPHTGGIRHSKAQDKVEGSVVWDFFTAGYVPLRLTSVFPRPHSRIAIDHAPSSPSGQGPGHAQVVVLSFSSKLDPNATFKDWISVDGLEIKSATYDASTYSVIFDFTKPMETPRAYRVEVSQERVYGARGEADIFNSQQTSSTSLQPLAQDSLLRSCRLSWKFFASESSAYGSLNLKATGLEGVVKRWCAGKITPQQRGRRRGELVHSPSAVLAGTATPVASKMVYRPPRESPAQVSGGEVAGAVRLGGRPEVGRGSDVSDAGEGEQPRVWAAPRDEDPSNCMLPDAKERDKLAVPPFPVPSAAELEEALNPIPVIRSWFWPQR